MTRNLTTLQAIQGADRTERQRDREATAGSIVQLHGFLATNHTVQNELMNAITALQNRQEKLEVESQTTSKLIKELCTQT